MKFSKKYVVITSIVVVVLVVLALTATPYFKANINPYLFSAAGLSQKELREGFIAKISNSKSKAVPGELVTYKFTFKHNLDSSAFNKISPVLAVEAKGAKVRNISNGGKFNNEVVIWEPAEMGYGQTITRTFQLAMPDVNSGTKYCVNAVVGMTVALPITIATASDCTTVVAEAEAIPGESVSSVFRQVFGRAPTTAELSNWQKRLEEKGSIEALKGAMQFAKAQEAKETADPVPVVAAPPVAVKPPASVEVPVETTQPQASPNPVNQIDPDGDGLPNDQEVIFGSDPNKFDTDGDGIPDGDEVRQGTNPAGDMIKPSTLPTPTTEISQISLPEMSPKQSFLGRFISNVTSPLRIFAAWFAKLF